MERRLIVSLSAIKYFLVRGNLFILCWELTSGADGRSVPIISLSQTVMPRLTKKIQGFGNTMSDVKGFQAAL